MKHTWKLLLCLLALVLGVSTVMALADGAGDESLNTCEHPSYTLEVLTPATCTSAGIGRMVCETCTYTSGYTVEIPVAAHKWEDVEFPVPSTCTESGTANQACTNAGCTATQTREVPASGHHLGCDSGFTLCVRCGTNGVEGEHGHIYNYNAYQRDATSHWNQCECGNDIQNSAEHTYSDGVCICGAVDPDTGTPECTEHSWSFIETITPATCTQDGVGKKTCINSGCTYYEEVTLTHLGHVYSWEPDGKEHVRGCMNCDEVDEEERGKHDVFCKDPTHCFLCNSTDVEGIGITHGLVTYEVTETQHTQICTDCSERLLTFAHTPSAEAPTVCATCKKQFDSAICEHTSFKTVVVTPGTCIKLTEAYNECTSCGVAITGIFTLNYGAHTPSETDDTKCSVCNATLEAEIPCTEEGGSHSYTKRMFNSDSHWYVCKYCEQLEFNSGYFIHYYTCTVRDACAECGATNLTSVQEVHHNWSYRSNSTQHWRVCPSCSLEYDYEEHTVSCAADTTCIYCEATDVTGTGGHSWDYKNYAYTDTHHWLKCTNCDAQREGSYDTHVVACNADDTSTCVTCSISGITCVLSHDYNFTKYVSDADYHWFACRYHEDAINSKEAHTPSADDATKCSVCGATIEEEEELTCKNGGNHSYTKTTYNQDNHWFICEYCGTTDTENGYWYSHYTDCNSRNACAGCGANNVTIHVDQHYKWELKSNETHHWRYCATCDVIFEKSQHTVSCVDENLCVECKATGVTGIGGHDWDYSTIASDATHHWRNCNNCDARDQYYQHDTYCDAADPTICISCKATGVTCGIVTHRVDYDVYYSDDYAHWQDCSLHPGEFICNLETHLVTCADTTTCTICKATGIKGSAQHTVDSNGWQHTATECWYTCSVCKQEVERGSHILDCTNDTCQYCRSTGVQGEYDHRYSGNTFEYDETHHWNYCFRCKEAEIRAEHYVSCVVNSTTCFDCNAENVTLTTKHIDIDRSKLIYDDNQHWYFCNGCNGPATKFDHSFKDGVCTCGKTESTACSHKYAWLNIQSPTCTQSGRMEHTCTNCKEVAETKVTSALGHSPTTSSTAATCTSAGQEITSCSRCGTTMSSSSIPALGHNPMTSTTSATCTTPGTETTSCSRCGATISSSSIPALGHNPTTSSTPATCTAAGLETTSCTTCGSTISSSTIPALGHDYVTTTQDATCTTEGLAQSICTRCGDVQSSEVLPMISHDRQYSTLSAATCTNDGVREWSCAICGQTMEREPIPAKGHSLSTTETATATVEKCSRCDYEKVTPKATATPAPTAVPTATPAPTVAPTATPAPTVEPTAEPTVEPTIEPTAAPTVAPAELPKDVVVKPVQNVVIEIELPVEEETEDETETEGEIEEDTEEEPQPEVEVKNVEISVNEVALEETPVVLPLPVEVEPAKVITIQMTIPEVTEEEKVAIPEKVKISLPVTEIEIESLANTKLVLVLEDGSMVEIPYELVDGKLVFTTTQMGVFAFIPME